MFFSGGNVHRGIHVLRDLRHVRSVYDDVLCDDARNRNHVRDYVPMYVRRGIYRSR